jgi:hypothetical protein
MVDVGQFLGLRASKRASRSAQAAAQAGILTDSQPIPQHAARFSARQIAVLFITLAAIASVPILLYPWPPLSDYINHLARMHVIATIGSDRDLALFYQVDWQVIPNLMMDLIVPILQRVMNVYLAGQVYTIMTFVLILSGTLALNRQLYRHWSSWHCSSAISSRSEFTGSACSHSSCNGCWRCDDASRCRSIDRCSGECRPGPTS